MELNKIYNEDCLVGMDRIPDGSVDMILTDLPYGTTACSWDEIIPFEPMWEQLERVIKEDGAVVLTASQPFTTKLIASNMNLFRYEWIYRKTKSGSGLWAKRQPMRHHENVLVFYKEQPTYNPQMTLAEKIDNRKTFNASSNKADSTHVPSGKVIRKKDDGLRYPESVQTFSNSDKTNSIHPTQKPVELFEYLIKTYTNKGETVLDATMGSGTTAIACLNTDRQYIGFETDEEYFRLANERIKNHVIQDTLF